MARDIFLERGRCSYCGRPAVLSWDDDLVTCGEEVCKTLAYAELHRRARTHSPRVPRPLPRAQRVR